MKILEIKNISKNYKNKEVLKNINLTIEEGKIVGLLGSNGAGKTTLIKLINDLLIKDTGEILFMGKPLGTDSKKQISYLPERTYLDKGNTIKETLKYFTEFYDNFNLTKAQKLLKDLDLEETMHLSKMSKGMLEKLGLILVMSRKAKLYILDEPLGGVDPATRDYIIKTILTNFDDGASLLISTHLISDIETILDEVIFLKQGEIYLHEKCDKLREKEQKSIDEIFRRTFKC